MAKNPAFLPGSIVCRYRAAVRTSLRIYRRASQGPHVDFAAAGKDPVFGWGLIQAS